VIERGSRIPCGEIAAKTATAITATAGSGILATAVPMKTAQNGSAKMRCRGERSGARPVCTRVARSGGSRKAASPQATKAPERRESRAAPAIPRARKMTKVQPEPPAKPRRASVS
jgi:hypothetical protein